MLLGIAFTAAHAENTAKHFYVTLKCPRDKVHVRIFDEKGNEIDEFEAVPEKSRIDGNGPDYIEGSKRYVVTSASKGCVQGQSDFDHGMKVNTFTMPCGTDAPLDLVITSSPEAEFTIVRTVQAPALVCRSEHPLNQGSSVAYFTSDETLIIEAHALSDPRITGRLVLDWDKVRSHSNKPMPNEGFPGQGGGSRSQNAQTAKTLKSFTIAPRPAQ